MSEWQAIETAPHATDVLLFVPASSHEGFKIEAGWASGGERTAHSSSMWWHGRATHWMPLPEPPEQSKIVWGIVKTGAD